MEWYRNIYYWNVLWLRDTNNGRVYVYLPLFGLACWETTNLLSLGAILGSIFSNRLSIDFLFIPIVVVVVVLSEINYLIILRGKERREKLDLILKDPKRISLFWRVFAASYVIGTLVFAILSLFVFAVHVSHQ